MGLFDFFKKKEVIKEKIEPVISVDSHRTFREHNCDICRNVIGQEKFTKKQGIWYHKRCFKQKLREMKKELGVTA